VAGLLSFNALPALSVGPFTDVSRESEFVRAPLGAGLAGAITRADSQGRGATVFDLGAFFPVRSAFLMQIETSVVTADRENGVAEGFGDVLLRSKARAWAGTRKGLFVTSCVRFGAGSPGYLPYATASTDIGLGVAFVDSLGWADDDSLPPPPRHLAWWVAAGGAYVARMNDRLKQDELHGHHLSGGGGVVLALTRRFEVEAGGLGLVFDSGAVREVYFSRVTAHLSPAASLNVTVQGERGDWRERAADASASAGLTVRY
jgi:hypothetical protein